MKPRVYPAEPRQLSVRRQLLFLTGRSVGAGKQHGAGLARVSQMGTRRLGGAVCASPTHQNTS